VKLSELKQQVYTLAQVSKTQDLKRKFTELRSLDMRKKESWTQMLQFLQSRTPSVDVDALQAEVAVAEERWQHEDETIAALSDRLHESVAELQDIKQDEQLSQVDNQSLIDEAEAYLAIVSERSKTKRKASLN
jgi:hypothetical protein